MAQLLTSHGADPNVENDDHLTVLNSTVVVRDGSVSDLMSYLLKAGARANEDTLLKTIVLGRSKTVKILLDTGVDPNPRLKGQNSPLFHAVHQAAEDGSENSLDILQPFSMYGATFKDIEELTKLLSTIPEYFPRYDENKDEDEEDDDMLKSDNYLELKVLAFLLPHIEENVEKKKKCLNNETIASVVHWQLLLPFRHISTPKGC